MTQAIAQSEVTRRAPRVSIGLPVYNGERFLRVAIDAILAQTFTDLELVICDNASTDSTETICREYAARDSRVYYRRNDSNIGAVPNYNRVLEIARGELFRWAAHDDVMEPECLKACVDALETNPRAVLAYSMFDYINEQGEVIDSNSGGFSINDESASDRVARYMRLARRRDDIYWIVFGLARTDAMRRACPMGLYIASDQIVLMRLLLQGAFIETQGRLFHRRKHAEASTEKRRTIRELAQWYAGGRPPGRVVLPTWHLYREYVRAVRAARLSLAERLRCRALIVRRFIGKKHFIWRDVKSIPIQLFGGDVPA